MKSKVVKAIIAAAVAIGVIVGGYYGYKSVFGTKTTVSAAKYITSTVRKMNMQVNIQGTGSAYAAVTKEIMPNNNGTLKDLSVKVGDTVTAGQKLFVSYSADVENAVTTAQNNLTDANINLSSAQNDLTSKQTAYTNAQNAAASESTTTSTAGNGSSQSTKTLDDYKLDVDKAKLTVEQNKLKVSTAKTNLANAKENVTKMTVTSPIAGVITAVNNANGDSVQTGKSVLTVVDMSSIKVKVSVDELDITKVKLGQKAEVKFDAIKDKTYEGTVESIAQTGTTSNNVTTYDVVVGIANPEGIKLGMNANVNILVESKENALVIPAEALIEQNGKKYVRVESTDSSASGTNTQAEGGQNSQNAQGNNEQAANTNPQNNNTQNTNKSNRTNNGQGTKGSQSTTSTQTAVNVGKLVEIKTGLENENYIEVIEGLTEGQKVIITLPQTSTTTNSNNNKNSNLGGFGGGMPSGGGRPMN
ncbi:efflux RND transporter periplasmic adaptor subunit [Clostridium sp. SYSU_GA19001]|uniref:efflux RND transporter periplasmic adaptor subunit n=1 Tax=Clostridium caldaquaticum TaxID=2940653 RepID=UPI0020776AB3|nr:efflux RND transporter periplasmic adaptor subunit [Clostridium caldaquaticum]MCM8712056.1 efflux RND transporter periplasmic adaptor subunit [Clostridium caldaquaticum]